MRNILYLSILFIVPALFSCSGDDNSDEKGNDPTDTISPAGPFDDSVGYRSTRAFFYSLPSPLAMAAVYKSSGLGYQEGICNDPKRAGNYSNLKSMALNLGIYAADLAYNIVNDQGQHSLTHLDAIKKLSDGLKLNTVFGSDAFIQRFKNNINSKDSLAYLVADLKQEMDLFMNENEKENLVLFIFSGSWVESIYISTQSIRNKPNDAVAHMIAEQKYLLDNLVDLLRDYEKEPNFKDLFSAMTDLKVSFDKTVSTVGEGVSITEVNESSIKEITEKVAAIRKKFITP